MNLLHKDWSAAAAVGQAEPLPSRRAAAPRRSAGAVAGPDRNPLAPEPGPAPATDLLEMLPRRAGLISYARRSRGPSRLLGPALPGPRARKGTQGEAQVALAKTGSTEEATAWAGAIAALLPDERGAATAEIVEALKYPTATEGATEVLLEAIAARWDDGSKIEGRSLPDPVSPRLAGGADARRRHAGERRRSRPRELERLEAAPGRG